MNARLPRSRSVFPRGAAPAARIGGVIGLLTLAALGCQAPSSLHAPQRYRHGLVLILPGIEGRSIWNRDIAVGLDRGGVTAAIEIFDWTTGVPGNFVGNLTDLQRNRAQARRIAERIVRYQNSYPHRSVHLIGHSGGGGVTILALEALPLRRSVDAAILLAPALSPGYDLTAALRHTRHGVYNFYSPRDVTLLKVGTTVWGSIDKRRGPAAGAVGFVVPDGLDHAGRQLYEQRLHQVRWSPRLRKFGADGSHTGWASQEFASKYLALLILEHQAQRAAQTVITQRCPLPVEQGK